MQAALCSAWLALFALNMQWVFGGSTGDLLWATFDAIQFRRLYGELSRD